MITWKELISTNSSLNVYIQNHSVIIGTIVAYTLLALIFAFLWYKREKFIDYYAEAYAKFQMRIWELEKKWSNKKQNKNEKKKEENQQPRKDSENSSTE